MNCPEKIAKQRIAAHATEAEKTAERQWNSRMYLGKQLDIEGSLLEVSEIVGILVRRNQRLGLTPYVKDWKP
jgi:hypothetical protein